MRANLPIPVATPSSLTLVLDAMTAPIASLTAARAKVMEHIRQHDLSASEYSTSVARVERDGKPYCRVSYFGKLWMLDEEGRETYREMNEAGEAAP